MAVILKNGAIFLRVPKTGSNWVVSVLREAGLVRCSLGHRHNNIDRLLAPNTRSLGRKCEYYFKRSLYFRIRPRPFIFCFVRHPLAWYESYFRYKSGLAISWKPDGDERDFLAWHPNSPLNNLDHSTFNAFMRSVQEYKPGYVSELFNYYTSHPVDFVGKQETLQEDLVRVLDLMGLDYDPEIVRAHPRMNVSITEAVEWEPALRAEVERTEYAGLRRYGYLADA